MLMFEIQVKMEDDQCYLQFSSDSCEQILKGRILNGIVDNALTTFDGSLVQFPL